MDVSATGGLATAEALSGIPKAQTGLRNLDREEFLRLAPEAMKSRFLQGKMYGYGLSA